MPKRNDTHKRLSLRSSSNHTARSRLLFQFPYAFVVDQVLMSFRPNVRRRLMPKCYSWTAPVHTLDMPKPVITCVFKVLQHGLLRYILYTCPNCDNVRVQVFALTKNMPWKKWKISRVLPSPSLDDSERRPLGVMMQHPNVIKFSFIYIWSVVDHRYV